MCPSCRPAFQSRRRDFVISWFRCRHRQPTDTVRSCRSRTAVCRSGYYQLRQLRPAVRCSSDVVQAFISSRLYYCNVLFYGITVELIRYLQTVQNAAWRLVTGTRRSDHNRLCSASCTGFRCGSASCSRSRCLYIPVPVRPCSGLPGRRLSTCNVRVRHMRSADTRTLAVNRTSSSFGHRTYAAAGTRVWNSLPPDLDSRDCHTASSGGHWKHWTVVRPRHSVNSFNCAV